MTNHRIAMWLVPGVVAVCVTPAIPQNETGTAPQIEPPNTNAISRVRVSYRMGLNVSTKFKQSGNWGTSRPGPATGGGIDRTYDDGYVRVDAFGNEHPPLTGVTWNWGYDHASQVPGNDTLQMHALTSTRTSDDNDDPQHGMEIMYNRQLGPIGETAVWGFEAGWGWTDFTFADRSGRVGRITDTYQLGGTVPPLAPFRGTFSDPNPLIDDAPSRSFGSVSLNGYRKLNICFHEFKLGPYIEIPTWKRTSAYFSAGLAVATARTHFRFNESVTTPSTGTLTRTGKGFDQEWLVGPYVGGIFSVEIAERTTAFVGAQYQNLGKATHRQGSRKAEVDFGESVFVNLGIGYDF